MTPEAEQFLRKAEKLLAEAEVMLKVDLNDAAGRAAYLASFHAAQAYVFEQLGRVLKTHNGLQSEFLRLTRDEDWIDAASRRHLSRSYNLKSIADYGTGPDAEVTAERAREAVADAKRFVEIVSAKVAPEQSGEGHPKA